MLFAALKEGTEKVLLHRAGRFLLRRDFLKWASVASVLAGGALAAQGWARRMSFEDKSVLITGGSRGLGLELARCFAAEGARLSLLARNREELKRARRTLEAEFDAPDVHTYVCDVTQTDTISEVVDEIVSRRGGIDVLINNAGVIVGGPVEEMTREDVEEALDVHFWGAYNLMESVLPEMEDQGGRIVNISSIGGLVAVPHLMPYTVSKFALTGLSDAMRAELAQYSIYVTTVCPGLMRTGSHVNAWFRGQHRKEFSWFALSGASPLLSINSRRAAKKIVRACRYGQGHVTFTLSARLLKVADRLFPNLVANLMQQVNRLLPSASPEQDAERRRGVDSTSPVAPSLLTYLSDRKVAPNNELDDSLEKEAS